MNRIVYAYKSFRPFSDPEAWGIFKIAAIGEACGWTLLITGILIGKYLTPHSNIAVQIAGHMHGTLFLIYIVLVLVVAPSLKWSLTRTLFAGLMSVPPYGSLMFELYEAHRRESKKRKFLLSSYCYTKLLGAS